MDLPFYLAAAHLIVSMIGLFEFAHAHGLRPSWKTPIVMTLGYLPYQGVLAYAALRAAYRQIQGINNWEKTQHVGAHRQTSMVNTKKQPATTV
jgi:hypothetical protein